jgi:hypothetical protein
MQGAGYGVDETVNVTDTCQEIYNLFYQYNEIIATTDLCYRTEQSVYACPDLCSLMQEEPYLGADTMAKKKGLVWVTRSSSILSFLGALFVLWDIVSDPTNRGTIYHQLLLGMAIFDICTALAWSLATLPMPKDEVFWVIGAQGTDATCTAQAFFVQLGLTSIFYNVSLSLYYLLVIVYGWREEALRKKIRPWLHGVPLLIGFGLAFAGIPFYGEADLVCYIYETPPWGSIWPPLGLLALPVGIAILIITTGMIAVYISVRKKSRAAQRWSLFGTTSELEQKVFWKAFWYVYIIPSTSPFTIIQTA